MVGITKCILCKLMDELPTGFLDDLIPEAKIALRNTATTSHGYKPAKIAFK